MVFPLLAVYAQYRLIWRSRAVLTVPRWRRRFSQRHLFLALLQLLWERVVMSQLVLRLLDWRPRTLKHTTRWASWGFWADPSEVLSDLDDQ